MTRLPEPELLTWVEADEHQRITTELADWLRARGEQKAARHLDYRAQQCRTRANTLAMEGN